MGLLYWDAMRPKTRRKLTLEFKQGYLIGALMLSGLYDGFYITPRILLYKQINRDLVEKLVDYAIYTAKDTGFLLPPDVLEYAIPGTYGVDCPSLRALAPALLSRGERLPLPSLLKQSNTFLAGMLAGSIALRGIVTDGSIRIACGVEHAKALLSILDRLYVPARLTTTGVSMIGRRVVERALHITTRLKLDEGSEIETNPSGDQEEEG